MRSSPKRLLSIGIVFVCLLATFQVSSAESATKNAHGRISSVNAVGGTNSATVSWKVEYYHYMLSAYSFYIQIYPKDHPFKTPVETANCYRSPCKFHIPTPKANNVTHPIPLKYYFVVIAAGGYGIPPITFASNPSASVVVKFQSTSTPTPTPTAKPSPTPTPTAKPSPTPTPTAKPSPTPTPTAKPSPTPTPTAKPSPTPTPSPTVPTVSDFDGNYSGVLNVALTPALIPPQTIPFSLAILNGMGSGGGGGWYAAGYVTDAQGSALIHISHPIYGTFDFPVSFGLVTSTQIKTGAASGSRTITYPGIGELTIDFAFTVATK